jgi:hypothetical protein
MTYFSEDWWAGELRGHLVVLCGGLVLTKAILCEGI